MPGGFASMGWCDLNASHWESRPDLTVSWCPVHSLTRLMVLTMSLRSAELLVLLGRWARRGQREEVMVFCIAKDVLVVPA